jgi:hypothetical protein
MMPDLALIISEDGFYTDIYGSNELLGIETKEFLIGNNVSNVLPEPLSKDVKEIIKKVIETNQLEIFKYQLDVQQCLYTFGGRLAPLSTYLADDPNRRLL